tara:strand:- start:606 stop:1058 length:453 start_codon:yes stop_codon:yes gene_type:complete
MRAVIQRVVNASVSIDGMIMARINTGLLILLGVADDDKKEDVIWLSSKIANLRIFDDQKGVMNISLKEHNGEALVVSQFTLHALTKKGNRPSYIKAASPEIALPIYNQFVEQMQSHLESPVKTGVFGANMKVILSNDGPATFIIDTKNRE